MNHVRLGLCSILAVLMLVGCTTLAGDDYATTTYKALASAKIFYDQGLTAAADAHRLGLIDDAQKAAIIEAGDAYREAWQASADALYLFSIEQAPADTVEEKLEKFTAAYLQFSILARPYMIRALSKE